MDINTTEVKKVTNDKDTAFNQFDETKPDFDRIKSEANITVLDTAALNKM